MSKNIIIGLLIPFLGTTFGSAMVFFIKEKISDITEKILLGFSSGVMLSAGIWSLLIPSINLATSQQNVPWLPAGLGIVIGVLFLFFLDIILSKIHKRANNLEDKLKNRILMLLAIIIHNIPDGMAVGISLASTMAQEGLMTIEGAIALSIGIAIQNFPEGAIVSMPLKFEGLSKRKAFLYGVLSGVVEPISACITIFLVNIFVPILPYILAFAAGSTMYIVVVELLPKSQTGESSQIGILGFTIGFVAMMILDIAIV